eukprot:TRINITY_DN10285_c0_g1_i1.p1 TRINITY_DN10285_c0_g1~~TRINITY_DN10285_c0_g1_i1.p1  ORF type:complete len:118 (-),score=22.47 TRINITY_DN10285_c0_g1_i1:151-504(-)
MTEEERTNVKSTLKSTVGFLPQDPVAWLYAARGFYRLGQYHNAMEALGSCLRHEPTRKEAQHLMAFCMLHVGQMESAAQGFLKSVEFGNETDWQPLVETLLDNPNIDLLDRTKARQR